MKLLDLTISVLTTGTAKKTLSNNWYNKGFETVFLILILSYTGYMSVEKFNLDFSGLNALISLIFSVFFIGMIFVALWKSIKEDSGSLIAFIVVLFYAFVLVMDPALQPDVTTKINQMDNGLVSLEYVFDRRFILTAETISMIGLLFFTFQCYKVAQENILFAFSRPKAKIIVALFSILIVSKPLYGLLGGSYSSFGIFTMLTLFVYSVQKYLLFYLNSEIKIANRSPVSFSKEYILEWLSIGAIIILLFFMDAPILVIGISVLFSLISMLMINYKSAYNNAVSILLTFFAVLYGLFLLIAVFLHKASYYFSTDAGAGALGFLILLMISFGFIYKDANKESKYKIVNRIRSNVRRHFFKNVVWTLILFAGYFFVNILFTSVPSYW
jgi:hypothetical protein